MSDHAQSGGEAQSRIPFLQLPRLHQCVQLHETIEIYYVVDGYSAVYNEQDGQIRKAEAKGKTILDALMALDTNVKRIITRIDRKNKMEGGD